MKMLGLLGGMSWESTVSYYRLLNEAVKERLGGFHSARVVLWSVDFAELERLLERGDWDAVTAALVTPARALEAAGAERLVICTNTMHEVAPRIEAAIGIPLLHIVDPTAEAIRAAGHRTVGLLGTRFTMERAFFKERLRERHGLHAIVPVAADREIVHRVVFDELCQGRIREESRAEYRRIMAGLVERGAEAVILGCTEIALLVSPEDATVPLFDTTTLHARAAVEWALG